MSVGWLDAVVSSPSPLVTEHESIKRRRRRRKKKEEEKDKKDKTAVRLLSSWNSQSRAEQSTLTVAQRRREAPSCFVLISFFYTIYLVSLL